MNRTAVVHGPAFVRLAGVLLAAAAIPVALAGAASASTAPSSTYADQVAIGTALKIAGPSVQAASVAVKTSATPSAAASDTSTAIPSDAIVIETESHQPAVVTDTRVAVLGTKIAGPTELANTGPKHLGDEADLAVLLISLGAMLVAAPRLWDSARRTAARTH
jgi:hypothetical protein